MPIEDIFHPLLKHYTAAPQWVKSSLGAGYAALPTRWRYGRAYEAFRQEIAQCADAAWLQRRAAEKLHETLQWAARTVPAYSGLLRDMPGVDDAAAWLARFPLLDKAALKRDPARYLSSAMPAKAQLLTHTGGSTSVPMRLYLHRFVSRSKDFAYNGEFDRIAGIGAKDVILALRGRTVPGAEQPGGPIWMFDPIKRYLHLSSDHLEPEHMRRYVEAMRSHRPSFIHAFPSAVVPLAQWLQAHPEPELTEAIRGVQLFSENVYDYQVALLEQVFGCPVLLDYGHSERAIKAISYPGDARYSFWPLYGHVELIGFDGQPITRPGVLGEIVATGFDNKVMPLIRYRTGDTAMWSARPNTARPGFAVVDRIEGRLQEFLVCSDRRLVSITTIGAAHFEQLAGADMMQFEQREPGHALLKVLCATSLSEQVRRSLAEGIREKTQGGLVIDVQRVDELPRTAAGKHRLLVQHIDLSGFLGAAGDPDKGEGA